MPRTLTGRSALVTGSTGGLGHALADRFAAEGCAVLLHGVAAPAEGEDLARDLAARHGGRALYRRADLARLEEIEALAPADWDADIAVNLSAAFHTIRLALPRMRARGWGRILNMSSVYGLFGAAGRAGYVTTKTALIGLTRAVALETARDRITCNALCPGSSPTPAIEARIAASMEARCETDRDAAVAAFLAEKQPSRRFVAPERVAAMAAFLCGPDADDITGAAIPLDGGWSAS